MERGGPSAARHVQEPVEHDICNYLGIGFEWLRRFARRINANEERPIAVWCDQAMRSWPTVAPSSTAFTGDWNSPHRYVLSLHGNANNGNRDQSTKRPRHHSDPTPPYSTSHQTHTRSTALAKISSNMPEKGWRKRLQEKRPKTPLQAKPAAAAEDVAPSADDQSDRLSDKASERISDRARQPPPEKHSWRKTYLGSRPQTPVPVSSPIAASIGEHDPEASPSSRASSDAPANRGKSALRPSFSRYMSDYLALSAPPKRQVKESTFSFSEPWSEESPFEIEPPVDPEVAIQEIRYHIGYHSSEPLPVEHYNGILRVFEDYRKLRDSKESLDAFLKDTLGAWEAAQAEWTRTEELYQIEIRRLDLLIAQGSTGMAGLMKARQGTVVHRRGRRQQGLPTDWEEKAHGFLSSEKLDEKIKKRSQRVIYHRPTSPSGAMATLSRRLKRAGSSGELIVGTPPDDGLRRGLTRKVKSELDLARLGTFEPSTSDSRPRQSEPSVSKTSGDPSTDEVSSLRGAMTGIGVECEAFVALRELATLVARRKGIDSETFVSRFMLLYSTDNGREQKGNQPEPLEVQEPVDRGSISSAALDEDVEPILTARRLRHFQSHPQLTGDKSLRRHFSFEPGDDDIGVLNEEVKRFELGRPKSPAGSQSTASSGAESESDEHPRLGTPLSRSQTLGADAPKPTKIPSPLSRPSFSTTRRESSTASLRTVKYNVDDKRDSRSSVLTAFRETSSGSLRRGQSASRTNSIGNLRQTGNEDPRNLNNSLKLRNSVVALAAARAAEVASSSASNSKPSSPANDLKQSVFAKPHRARKEPASRRGKSSENKTLQTRG